MTLTREGYESPNAVKDLLSQTAGGLRAIVSDISPNIRDVFGREGMKFKSLRQGSFLLHDPIFPLAEAFEERLSVNWLHPPAFQIVIPVVQHFARLL